jgi:hypothetical protein
VLEVVSAETASEAARDEDRLPFVGDSVALELLDRDRDRSLARVLRRTGERERRRLDEHRRTSSAGDEAGERRPGERKAKRVTHGAGHVDDVRRRGRGTKDDVSLVHGHEDDPRAREQGNTPHVASRYSRRELRGAGRTTGPSRQS